MPTNYQHRDDDPKTPGEPRGERLRIDPVKVEAARRRLADVDGTVFATADKHTAAQQNARVAEIVTALFADG